MYVGLYWVGVASVYSLFRGEERGDKQGMRMEAGEGRCRRRSKEKNERSK